MQLVSGVLVSQPLSFGFLIDGSILDPPDSLVGVGVP